MSKFSESLLKVLSERPDDNKCQRRVWAVNSAKEVLEAASNDVNAFGFKAKEQAEDAMAAGHDNLLRRIVFNWIEYYAVTGHRFADGRNEAAVERLGKVFNSPSFEKFENCLGDIPEEEFMLAAEFANQSVNMHKTLMQSFTKVILHLYNAFTGTDVDATLPLV